ncbi:hypothetical protein OBBRIDRAFT_689371, partial [Obba rivulosa]
LREELIFYPLILSIGSLTLSMFMSTLIFDALHWQSAVICTTSDIIAMSMDHYFDHIPSLAAARKIGDITTVSTFTQARILLATSVALLFTTLLLSPPLTWAAVVLFFGPAFIWNFDLSKPSSLRGDISVGGERKTERGHRGRFSVKRIPGMKAVLDGVIRGGGIFAVNYSMHARAAPRITGSPQIWSARQIVIWSTINHICHSVMTDIRDFHEDEKDQVLTIPVILGSIQMTRTVLTLVHLSIMWACVENLYIVFSSLYSMVLVWSLNPNSPRRFYSLSFHSQTLTVVLYG